MGFCTNIELPHGVQLIDCYINIGRFAVKKYGQFYLITITFFIHQCYEYRKEERIALYEKQHIISTDSLPDSNFMVFLYDHLKKIFEYTIDM